MNALRDWTVEPYTRLGKLVLIVLKNNEPKGSITFEEDEEEEAAAWTDLVLQAAMSKDENES